jgi:hypothetical protein
MFFEEVKRTVGSHDEKNHRRSPHLAAFGDDRAVWAAGEPLVIQVRSASGSVRGAML